jgi:hypothetical protein
VQTRKTGLFDFIAEIVQRLTGFFHTVVKTLHEFLNTEYREYRLSIDPEVIRLPEILVDDPVHNDLKIFPVYFCVPEDVCLILVTVHIPVIIFHVVVGPHYIKLHLPVVRGFQETIVKSTFKERAFVIPVPVVYEYINAMISCCINPFFNHFRIVVRFISPKGLSGLIVTLEPWIPLLNHFPFTSSLRPEHFSSQWIVMA